MSGLKHTTITLEPTDIDCIKKGIESRRLKVLLFAFAFVVIAYYTWSELYYSNILMLMAGMLLIVVLADIFILFKEQKDLGLALKKGMKDVYEGAVLTTYKKKMRTYRRYGYYYFVVMKGDMEEKNQEKKKIRKLADSFEETGNEADLELYEKMMEKDLDNERINISYNDFMKIKPGSKIAFHCLSEVRVGSWILPSNSDAAFEISSGNYFLLRTAIEN